MWRHGDIIISKIASIPDEAMHKQTSVLAWGEITGHSHRVEDPHTAEIYEIDGAFFIRVIGDEARIIHEEHKPITLLKGNYKFWFQREYTPREVRRIAD